MRLKIWCWLIKKAWKLQIHIWSHLSRDAPRASTIGSAISNIDCRMEATTMKRMMERRKALWMTWSSISPVWTARISSVMPSVIPLQRQNTNMPKTDATGKTLTRPHASTCRRILRPVHGVVIYEGSVTLKIELAECKNSQSDEGDGENKAQQGVWRTTTFCNTVDNNQINIWIFLVTISLKIHFFLHS